MKKSLLLSVLVAFATSAFGRPTISDVAYPNNATIFDLFEISFQLSSYSNPYDPNVIDVYAEFTDPNGKIHVVYGFYFQDYHFEKYNGYEKASANIEGNGWRVRFTPDKLGQWRFKLRAVDRNGQTELSSYQSKDFSFQCQPADNAYGFITKANTRFLKRGAFVKGKPQQISFFPIGPNVPWYFCKEYYDFTTPQGIYEYHDYIDALANNANYMRIWINRFQYMALFGPEFTQTSNGNPMVYFNNTINQKDAAELDEIVAYSKQHDINLALCFFNYKEFRVNSTDKKYLKSNPGDWSYNPFHTQLGLKSPHDFFTHPEAKRITKILFRYIVSRWGYATNIMCWEFFNELNHIFDDVKVNDAYFRDLVDWHEEMAEYIRSIDPYHHLVTTSVSSITDKKYEYLGKNIYRPLDIVQCHTYGNIQKAKSKEQRSHQLFEMSNEAHLIYPDKPYFIGEFGFGQSQSALKYEDKDPFGIDTHNCLWSSLFSTSIGSASFWFWTYLKEKDLFHIFKPMVTFSKGIPITSDSFTAHSTASTTKRSTIFPNGLQTYYMINADEDTLYGWCQDTAFAYQSLRRLTDREGSKGHFDNNGVFNPKGYVYTLDAAKKPKPCSKSNTITLPMKRQPAGTKYTIRWYDAETGFEIVSERTMAVVEQESRNRQSLSFEFPSSVRDLSKQCINNTFGDAVFVITREQNDTINGGTPNSNAANAKAKRIRLKRGA